MMKSADTERASRIRNVGLRATWPRLAILGALESDRRHPTAEMLHADLIRQNPSISLSTVYATLESFLRRGLVRRIAAPSGKLRVDGTIQDHDHAFCRGCGKIYDIDSDAIERPAIPSELPAGLRVMDLHIEYEVLCPECVGNQPAVAKTTSS